MHASLLLLRYGKEYHLALDRTSFLGLEGIQIIYLMEILFGMFSVILYWKALFM